MDSYDVLVIGSGPAGVAAALRAADQGARTALVTRGAFGGMAANDGPVPVRTLAHAARLLREARQLGRYGIVTSEPVVDYPQLLDRVRQVVDEVRRRSAYRAQIDAAGVTVRDNAGMLRFVAPQVVESAGGTRLTARHFILCTGGVARRLAVPGGELAATHSDAWSLTAVPESMLVIGAGATGAQVASIFHAFGTRVQLFQTGPRILPTEDEAVSAAMAQAFRDAGIVVHEGLGAVESFEQAAGGIRMRYSRGQAHESAEAALAVLAVGWRADTADLGLDAAGVELDARGFVRVDAQLRTSQPHIYAAGDVTGRLMLVPQALHDGFVAATNALGGSMAADYSVSPVGSFTDPEYAQVGLTETRARAKHDCLVTVVPFDATTRTIIDGRTTGFCKLIVDRPSGQILGCHIVGERAVDIVQAAAIAMAGAMPVDRLAFLPISFPTYPGVLARAAASATRELRLGTDARSARMEHYPP
ncbi:MULTISPECIES: dihydrolipoyl dehydrogenase family protein [Ramlibacter]|uniref:FAD-dependent oxidoreductase n=1 Tax=Ramlibacter pinisoli TaxID=2682844 RepID=A0A6N8IWF9_9BURK|nr:MULTISPECIES: NAD(P)/FAD-dependent oxidoreductase [Ramlibacter]MBA2960939.1 NAD(P)/FAD-dependent oxidoreductase [Ramlibacter sp. CGMCC 1.13660]MVQ30885.1 FAD-dependent oxidoreductase [Ramlibacter pinisoli]